MFEIYCTMVTPKGKRDGMTLQIGKRDAMHAAMWDQLMRLTQQGVEVVVTDSHGLIWTTPDGYRLCWNLNAI